ncbi:MAG: glycoside hydrolase family 2 protein [Acidimicrobiales bacterium]
MAARSTPFARRSLDLNSGWQLLVGGGRPARSGLGLPRELVTLPWENFVASDYEVRGTYERSIDLSGTGPSVDRARKDGSSKAFVDFGSVMASARVFIDDELVLEHEGGFTAFSVPADQLLLPGRHRLRVDVDAARRATMPPFGGECDFDTPGGIWGGVTLRVVPPQFLVGIAAITELDGETGLTLYATALLEVSAAGATKGPFELTAQLVDLAGGAVIGQTSARAERTGEGDAQLSCKIAIPLDPESVQLWSPAIPVLYQLEVEMTDPHGNRDRLVTRVGLREVAIAGGVLTINSEPVKLLGLNRHALFPYMGYAAGGRGQRRDAELLRWGLNCNIVRTSHYPQSPAFLDACDEVGLLVIEEVPGWQHLGDEHWRGLLLRDLEAMIARDRNHPSVVSGLSI